MNRLTIPKTNASSEHDEPARTGQAPSKSDGRSDMRVVLNSDGSTTVKRGSTTRAVFNPDPGGFTSVTNAARQQISY